jgi:hypothetical protein
MFLVFDIETLGIESDTVILSLAMTKVDPSSLPADNNAAYLSLLRGSFFSKLNVAEQRSRNRSVEPDTMAWWKKQGEVQKAASVIPHSSDQSVQEMYDGMVAYLNGIPDFKNLPVWIRGSLDQVAFDSLLRSFGLNPIVNYNAYRDIRTAIDLIYPESKAGYIEVPGLDIGNVVKHHPTHDCCYDALQLIRGKSSE